jgi:hypothetical protein
VRVIIIFLGVGNLVGFWELLFTAVAAVGCDHSWGSITVKCGFFGNLFHWGSYS